MRCGVSTYVLNVNVDNFRFRSFCTSVPLAIDWGAFYFLSEMFHLSNRFNLYDPFWLFIYS